MLAARSTMPNKLIEPIHNRMPLVLSNRDAEDWMNPIENDALSLTRPLVPPPDDLLVVTPASPLINSVQNEGLELLDAAGCGVNKIPALDEQIKAAWSQVLNQYQRRADLIPNLIATVKDTHIRSGRC
jgi:SOS response associated peptidase (SRAP)/LemA family